MEIPYQPFLGLILVPIFIIVASEIFIRRKISPQTIANYGRNTLHRKNNPGLYSSEIWVTEQIKLIRAMSVGGLLIGLLVFITMFLVTKNEKLLAFMCLQQNHKSVIIVLIIMSILFIYGFFNLTERSIKKILLFIIYLGAISSFLLLAP